MAETTASEFKGQFFRKARLPGLVLLVAVLAGPVWGIMEGPPSVKSGCVIVLVPVVLSLLRIAHVFARLPGAEAWPPGPGRAK